MYGGILKRIGSENIKIPETERCRTLEKNEY
jgi:hypothetical protein